MLFGLLIHGVVLMIKMSVIVWIVSPQNLYVETLLLLLQNETVFEIESLKGLLSLNEVIKVTPDPIWMVFVRRGNLNMQKIPGIHTHRGKTMWGDSEKAALYISRGERPQKKPSLLIPWSWTPSLLNCEKINFSIQCQSPLLQLLVTRDV